MFKIFVLSLYELRETDTVSQCDASGVVSGLLNIPSYHISLFSTKHDNLSQSKTNEGCSKT